MTPRISHRLILLLLWFPLIVATEARPDEPNEPVRVGTYRSIREHTGKTGLGVTVFGTQSIVHHNRYYDYQSLVSQVARFLKTGKTPVSPDETLEEFAFMEAAEASKRQGGRRTENGKAIGEFARSGALRDLGWIHEPVGRQDPCRLAAGTRLSCGRWPDRLHQQIGGRQRGNETDKLLTERTYRDFRLRFDYRFDRCANNGIALRCPPTGKASALGLEVQLIDAEPLVTRAEPRRVQRRLVERLVARCCTGKARRRKPGR